MYEYNPQPSWDQPQGNHIKKTQTLKNLLLRYFETALAQAAGEDIINRVDGVLFSNSVGESLVNQIVCSWRNQGCTLANLETWIGQILKDATVNVNKTLQLEI